MALALLKTPSISLKERGGKRERQTEGGGGGGGSDRQKKITMDNILLIGHC